MGCSFLLQTSVDQSGDHMEMNFAYYPIQKLNVTNS